MPGPVGSIEHVPPASPPNPPRLATIAQPERWRRMIKNLQRQWWPRHPLIQMMDDAAADRSTANWIA